jgi:isopentenyl-diphosphate Delta-isomerase
MSELFDVVDEHDRVLRQERRVEVHRQRLLHRAVHVLVFNSRSEVYLQRRSATKDTYPNRWTTSCSGHVDAGEDYDTAVVRELAEELGMKGVGIRSKGTEEQRSRGTSGGRDKGTEGQSDKGSEPKKSVPCAFQPETRNPKPETDILLPFLKHPPCRETGWEFIWIYTLTTDTPPAPDPGEISEGRWISPADLDAWMTREPKAFTPSFILVWKLWRNS